MADFPLPPGSVIGILGGGQLGRMLALAAARLGLSVVILTPEAASPASQVAARTIIGAYDDPAALAEAGPAQRRDHLRVRERSGRGGGGP